MSIRFTISAEGSSDEVFGPILRWTLRRFHPEVESEIYFGDFRGTGRSGGLLERLRGSVALYPCDVLVVHRDAEGQEPGTREKEIREAVAALKGPHRTAIVVPVRMTEAWLLTDEVAIRVAAGFPRGGAQLGLPKVAELERLADPKERLHQALRVASGSKGRRLKLFSSERAVHRVAEQTATFENVAGLPGFVRFRESLARALGEQ